MFLFLIMMEREEETEFQNYNKTEINEKIFKLFWWCNINLSTKLLTLYQHTLAGKFSVGWQTLS